MLRLVIFDLDGTLVDTAADITDALNYAMAPHGLGPLDITDTVSMVGEGLTRLIEKVLGNEHAALTATVLESFIEYYSSHLIVHSRLYPRVRETIEGLGRLKKAVISNKREALSRRLLEGLGLAGHFDLIVGSDTTAERKPSPVPVLHVLERLGIESAEAVMVGDSNYDIEAAKGAGLKTVAVTYGYRSREALKGADCMIEDMAELSGALDKLN